MTDQQEFNEATVKAMENTGKALENIGNTLRKQQEQIDKLSNILLQNLECVSILVDTQKILSDKLNAHGKQAS